MEAHETRAPVWPTRAQARRLALYADEFGAATFTAGEWMGSAGEMPWFAASEVVTRFVGRA